MKLAQSKNANPNYLAKVVRINEFHSHPDPEVTRLKCCKVDGYNIIVGIDEQPGLFIYFPTSCTLNPKFLAFSNLYKHKEMNINPEKSGMFEDNGRVKTIKLRKCPSEGFMIPVQSLQNWIVDSVNREVELTEGAEFDVIQDGSKEFWVCKKYVVEHRIESGNQKQYGKRQRRLKKFNKLVDGQFRFHYDTIQLKKEPYVIGPDDLIQISEKRHGTSGISAYVLCRQLLTWKQKIAHWLTGEQFLKYDYIYSSRGVIKNANINLGRKTEGFYECDVWSEADKKIRPFLTKGLTVYYEIIGFLPNGRFIQKGYDYGNVPPTGEYKFKENFNIYVYRITYTDPDGRVFEYSTQQVRDWALNRDFEPMNEYYYGKAGDLYPDIKRGETWSDEFLEHLANDKRFYMEMKSPSCRNNVPHEGIVIKKENGKSEAWKVKCFKFLDGEQAELDAGIENIEDSQ